MTPSLYVLHGFEDPGVKVEGLDFSFVDHRLYNRKSVALAQSVWETLELEDLPRTAATTPLTQDEGLLQCSACKVLSLGMKTLD